MLGLILLIAVAYAGARGVEKLVGVDDRRFDTPQARQTVAKVAAMKTQPKPARKPGPTDPGGTFSAMAPRAAAVGGKVAVPLAVLTTTGATMWQASLEGYRQAWPEIRAEHQRKMAERAARRQAEKDAAASAPAKPQPVAVVYPPMPTNPPTIGTTPPAPAAQAAAATTKPLVTKASPASWLKPFPSARQPTGRAADDQTIAAVIDEASALVNDASSSSTANGAAAGTVTSLTKNKPDDTPSTTEPTEQPVAGTPTDTSTNPGPHARPSNVVPFPTPSGDPMASPHTAIPEIRTLDGLMNALVMTRAMCEMRAEEAEAIAADDLSLSNRLDALEAELDALEVDDGTRGEISALREAVHAQSKAAASYGGAAKDSADLAMAVAAAAHKSHGGIAEAVQSSPIPVAAQAGYYEH